jgi:hypothetical protein
MLLAPAAEADALAAETPALLPGPAASPVTATSLAVSGGSGAPAPAPSSPGGTLGFRTGAHPLLPLTRCTCLPARPACAHLCITGPSEDAPPASPLPPRWGGMTPADAPMPEPDSNATASNPFVSRDVPPLLVQAAQGSAVSGGRTLGYRTGGGAQAELRLPSLLSMPLLCLQH